MIFSLEEIKDKEKYKNYKKLLLPSLKEVLAACPIIV